MRNLAKITMMLAFLAVVVGCNTEENYQVIEPDDTTLDARVVGHIHGVVMDGANNALLAGVEVELTRGGESWTYTTTAGGHYTFTNVVPGTYTLSFVHPDGEGTAYAAGVNRAMIPEVNDLEWVHGDDDSWPYPTDRDFHYEVVCDMRLFPLTGTVTGQVKSHIAGVSVNDRIVIADFANPYLAGDMYTTRTGADGSYSFTGLPVGMELDMDKNGMPGAAVDFVYGMMPETFDCSLRTAPVSHDGVYYTAYPVALNLQWGEWVAEDLVLMPADGPRIIMKNFFDLDENDSARFPVDGIFVARFNVPMDDETFVAELTKTDTGEGVFLGDPSWVEEIVTISPADGLDEGTNYTLVLSGVSTLGDPYAGSFDIRTVGFGDPMVVSDNFSDGRRLPIDTALTLHFNTLMSDTDYDIALYYADVAKDGGEPLVEVPTTVDIDGNVVTITPTAALMYDTDYHLMVEMMTIGGVPFVGDDDWVFTTESLPEPVFNYDFEDYDEFPVPVDAVLTVTYPMAMDPASVVIDFDVLYDDTALWSAGNTVLTIAPMMDLEFGTEYTLGVTGLSTMGYAFDDEWTFETIGDGQGVQVIDHNLVEYFALDGIPSVTFSTAMDPVTFTSTYGGFVTLEQDGEVLEITTAWTAGNTVLTITPAMPFLPNADLELSLRGQSVDGVQLTDAMGNEDPSFEFSTINMDAPTIVATNVVDGEFQPYIRVPGDPVVINPPALEFTFSVAMDPETVEFDLWRSALPDPIAIEGADPVWSEGNTVVTFTPYVRLLPLQTYFVGISGESVDGVELDGGLNHDGPADPVGYGYFYPFDTAGGLQFLRHDIFRIDGDNTNIPADDPRMVLYFNAPEYGEVIDLNADGTLVTLMNQTVAPETEVAIELSYDEAAGTLTITPVNMPLDYDTQYEITYTLFTTLPGDEISTDDPDVDSIVFVTGPETTQTPVVQVDGLLQVADYTADFDTGAGIELVWNQQANADGYYVYARVDDGTELKDDYLRVADIPNVEDVDLIEALVNIDAAPFVARFDTRDDDTPYTPFENQAILFRVAAYNDLGEGVKSDFARVADEVGPSGGTWAGQFEDDGVTPASADNSAGAEDVTIYLAFEANEYLDHTVEADAIIEITEDFTESLAGDPNWFLTPEDVEITYEDMDGYTAIVLALTIPAGFNAAGDLVTLLPGSLKDTSGNDYADEDPVTWTLLDTTAPAGILMDEDPLVAQIGSADNTNDLLPGGNADRTFDVTFIARELLNPAAVPTLYLDGVDVAGIANIAVDAVTYDPAVINDTVDATFSTVTVTFEIDWVAPNGISFAGQVVTISDLEDIARDVDGNPAYNASGATEMPEAVEDQWTLADRTPPAAEITPAGVGQNPGSADNSGGVAALTVEYTITAAEDCVDQDIEFRIFQSDGETQVIPPAGNINLVGWSDPQTYVFEIDVPAGEDWTDYIIEFWNIEDLQGNAVSSDEPYSYDVE